MAAMSTTFVLKPGHTFKAGGRKLQVTRVFRPTHVRSALSPNDSVPCYRLWVQDVKTLENWRMQVLTAQGTPSEPGRLPNARRPAGEFPAT